MSYTLTWKNRALNANKAADILVPIASVVSNKASIRFTGKGAPGYGTIQQENLMRLLENFADAGPPLYPTVGQEWYDTSENTLRICTSTSPLIWKALGGIQITAIGGAAPSPASVGDIWFERTGTQSGILYLYTGLGRYPDNGSTMGGWSQIWPAVETIAGREEYIYVRGTLVEPLVGPTSGGGNGAIGRAIPFFPLLSVYDASLQSKFAGVDANVLSPANGDRSELLADVNSNDWDTLLAAAKYAVNRLDLPQSMLDDISPVPFVSDGRPAPASLLTLATDDVRYPSLERRSNRRFGIVTLMRAFTETVNVLNAALTNRYSIKGINGTNGANPAFASTTEVVSHASFTGPATSTTPLVMKFNFATATDMQSFLTSGGAIQVTMSHNPGGSGTPADTNLKNLLDSRGVMRLTADKARVFANVFPLTMSVAPTNVGILNAPSAGVVLTTQSVAGAQVTVSAGTNSTTQFRIEITMSGGGTLNGTTTISFQVIRDNSIFNSPSPTKVFGAPVAYAVGDKSGSTSLV